MPRCEYLNRYPADVICLFEFSPLFDPGASFCWRVCLAQIHHLPASVLSRGFIFQAQARHTVAAESDQNRHAYCTIRKVRAWNLQRWQGRGPAHLIPARCAGLAARSAASVCCQARILWKLWADATWRRAPMPRSAQWIVHNTNHWAAVRPNMIPGKIRVPTLIVHAKWDDDLPVPGSERRRAAQKHFLRSSDRVAKELVRWRWRGTGCNCSAR